MSDFEKHDRIITALEIRANKVMECAEKAQKKFEFLFKVLVGSVFVAVVIVTTLSILVDNNKKVINDIRKEYAPLWFVNDINENTLFAIKEIALVFADSIDHCKLNELMDKYQTFTKNSLIRLAQLKEATSGQTRSYVPSAADDSLRRAKEIKRLEKRMEEIRQ